MDAQTTLADNAALVALVQSIVRRAVEEDETLPPSSTPQEVLAENRFLAARDGMDAELVDHMLGERVPARELLADLVVACRPHAQALGCEAELEDVARLAATTGAKRQLEKARALGSLPRLVAVLADEFLIPA
jgi:carboxylate-amine ligase